MRLDDVLAILEALEAEGVDYAVIGAMALAAHGLDRATRDLDLFVSSTEENVARLRRALHAVFEDDSIEEITSADLAGEYPVIQYGPPDARFTIDIVASLGDAFAFADLEVMEVDVRGRPMRVVTPAMLYRMKRDTVRDRDRDDAERLRHAFDLED